MNGVRSTFMRRGYLLTALSALLLLAASAGTAEAQVTGTTTAIRIDGADAAGVVQEGKRRRTLTVTVNKACRWEQLSLLNRASATRRRSWS